MGGGGGGVYGLGDTGADGFRFFGLRFRILRFGVEGSRFSAFCFF